MERSIETEITKVGWMLTEIHLIIDLLALC